MDVTIQSDLAEALYALSQYEGTTITVLVELAVSEFLSSMEYDLDLMTDLAGSDPTGQEARYAEPVA